jgi:multidrug transporter EmrE-like cation transporter
MKAVFLVTLCSVVGVVGQVLLKYGLQRNDGLWKKEIGILSNFILWFQNPYLLASVVVCAVGAIFFIYLLGKYELSHFYPLTASAYIFAFFAGVYFFNEQATISKVVGLVVICIGIVIISI